MIPSGKDTHIFTGIMDMDTEARYFASGNYRYLLNARTSINTQGSFGALEDVMGNVLVTNPYLFNGRNKVIGSCEDIAGQSCIYFVWNELGYHGIFRWYANRVGFPDGLIETIYQVRFPNLYNPDTNPNSLSFDENKLITGVNLVDDLLYWTDYNREPKVINIVRANNTNKKLSFNFYLDTTDLSISITYNFSLFIENTLLPVYGISITSSSTTLVNRVANIAFQLNADPLLPNFLTVENKNQYIQFTCVNTGNYYLTEFDTGINQSIVLPENHYPDYISGTLASFPALTEDVLKRVKYPPFCAPEIQYETESGALVTQITTSLINNQPVSWIYRPANFHIATTHNGSTYTDNISPAISLDVFDQYFLITQAPTNHPFNILTGNPDGGGAFYLDLGFYWATTAQYNFEFILFTGGLPVPQVENQFQYLGFQAELNDFLGIVTLGSTTSLFVTPTGISPQGYISVTQSTTLTIKIDLQVSVNLQQGSNNAVSFELWIYKYQSGTSTRVQLIYKTIVSVTNANINQQIVLTAQPGFRYGIGVEINGVTTYISNPMDLNTYSGYQNGRVINYSVNIGALDISTEPIVIDSIINTPFLFRNKYYFNDNEQSVLGTISKLPLPNTNLDKYINVNYDDKWLNNISYLSTIKFIYLYVSKDNGLTWSQWQKVNKWVFGPNFNRVDYYNDKEILTTVSPEEALLPYHSVPLKSKAQEYINDRIWDGAIVEGYDGKIISGAFFSNNVRNIFSNTRYNNTPYLSEAGFRYGYEGYVGIVYYDNADRKSSVNLITQDKVIVPTLAVAKTTYANISNIITQAKAPVLFVTLDNTPPDWATKYQVVITKDLAAVKSLVWLPTQVRKVDVSFVVTTSNPRYWEINLDNIPYYIDNADLGTQISYTFQQGDRVRFLAYGGGLIVSKDFDVQILAAVSNKIYVGYDAALPWEQGGAVSDGLNCYLEIYNGQIESSAEEATFYEIGQCYEIAFDSNLQKYHTANFQNQDYATNTPATIRIENGGYYYRKRVFYTGTSYTPSLPSMIWSGTINDFNAVDSDGFGRVNIISNVGQQYRYSTFRFSDQYQEVLNGLSANQPLNFTQMNLNYGDLNKMQVVNNDVLKLIFGNSYQVSIYVNQGVIRQSQGATPIISVSDQVAGNSHIIQRTLGTINAESVYVNDEGDMFGYDENEGVVWISSGNGLLQISDRGVKSVFKRYSNERKTTGGISETPCVYDLYHDEYILTLGDIKGIPMIPPSLVINNIADLGPNYNQVFFDLRLLPQPPGPWMYAANAFYPEIWKLLNSVLVNGGFGYTITHTPNPLGGPDIITITAPNYNDYANKQLQITLGNNVYVYTFTGGQAAVNDMPGSTIAYNKQKQGWTSYYSFVPEYYGRVRDYVVSFKDGQLWKHDVSPLAKNFYGTQYTRQLKFVSNKDFPKVKQYKALGVTGIGKNDAPSIFVPPYEGVPTGMLSSLSARFFETLEGIQYAILQKDRLSPGFGGNQLQALVNGRSLKGQTIEITLENTDTSKSSIYSADVVYFYSENS